VIVHVVGAGLAGSEVVYQLAIRGIEVVLHEMRPIKMTEVHKTDLFAELVCSNSLKSEDPVNAEGLLKKEMELLGSLILEEAYKAKIPAGKALAVDRERFSKGVTERIKNCPGVSIIREEIKSLTPSSDEIWVVATGPATSPSLTAFLKELLGEHFLHFFDAVAPIVTYETVNLSKVFFGDRFEKESKDYINCPLDKEDYERLWKALVEAETIEIEDFDKKLLFERCKPIEEIAKSGKDALRFGPLRPTGLVDPRTGKEPYAVVQLRRDNMEGTLYNLVGFQTRLKWKEQKKVIRIIPGLEKVEIVRYGVMHRNIYINSPKVLDPFMRLRKDKRIFFAGQITGVEGYVESAASGIYVAYNIYRMLRGKEPVRFPRETMLGSLFHYVIEGCVGDLKPMYANFGLLPKIRVRDRFERRRKLSEIAIKSLENFLKEHPW